MGIKHGYTATGTNDGAKQVSVNRWNDDHLIVGEVDIPIVAGATAPADGYLGVYAQKIGGRTMLTQMGPSGLDTTLQPNLGGNKVALWMPPGNSNTLVPGLFGFQTMTATGTATARNVATTNIVTRMTRMGYVSAATAGSLAGLREPVLKYTTGAGGGLGGFHCRIRFAVSDAAAVAGARMFVGLNASSAAMTNVEYNTLVNVLGVIQHSGSNNLQIYGAGAVAGTPVDLGSGFPANTLSTEVYELAMFAPTAGACYWQVRRLSTQATVEGTFASIPVGTVLLCPNFVRGNNATALAVGLDVCGIYMETDY